MEVDINLIPQSLIITDENGVQSINYQAIKTQADIETVLNAKRHVKDELNQYKEMYKDVDIEKYRKFAQAEFDNNKDVLENPVYKALELKLNETIQNAQSLQSQLDKRDAELLSNSIKDEIRKTKLIQESAIEDAYYRLSALGITKTEQGLITNSGETLDSAVEKLQTNAPHLFKRTIGVDNQRAGNLKEAIKNNSLSDALKNAPKLN